MPRHFALFLLAIVSLLLVTCKSRHAQNTPPSSPAVYTVSLGKVAKKSIFRNDSMSIWGGSVVKDDAGIYHMYYSRWPRRLGWAWVTDSEIAHATAPTAFGPFTFQDVTLPRRGADYWDGWCTHNPTVRRYNGKYYLYYMGNTGDQRVTSIPGAENPNAHLNWSHRNLQRIGVAVADNPNGPWERFDEPLIDVSPDSNAIDALMTSNPSITQLIDGSYLLIYKGVAQKKRMPFGGPVAHGVAVSNSPTGPFYKQAGVEVFTIEGDDFPAEDPFIWHHRGAYRAIVKDMRGIFTEAGRSLALFNSDDGLDWTLSEKPLLSDTQIFWEDGSITDVDHLERPQLYVENGEPLMLVCAADTLDGNGVRQSFNVQIPVIIK
ncbi:glycoside hydrolase family protein [Neolewinella agarilytica]|uniref:glycoside hydrolase family protein n=1 Tax=Neolewinella agarilytica TaxID=478744 RepID=UPI002354D482|nr:glycoside hydrolase family protein [Neolewinella agarilytica]